MRMSAAARVQGNFYVAKSCITSMQQLKASSYSVYSCELELNISKALQEMDHTIKADVLVDALSKFEDYVVSI